MEILEFGKPGRARRSGERAFACCNAGENAYYLGPYVAADNCSERLLTQAELTSDWTFVASGGLEIGVAMPNLAVLDRAAAEGRVQIDSTVLATCLESLRTTTCNTEEVPEPPIDGCDPNPPADEPDPCDPDDLIVGLVGEGGACDEALGGRECAEGLVCAFQSGSAFPFAKDAGANGTCERPKVVNEVRYSDQECEEGLYCSQKDGTCQVPSALDQPCEYSPVADVMSFPDSDLLLVDCEPDLTCSPTIRSARAASVTRRARANCSTPVPANGACTLGYTGQCAQGTRCADLTNDAVANPLCVALVTDGNAKCETGAPVDTACGAGQLPCDPATLLRAARGASSAAGTASWWPSGTAGCARRPRPRARWSATASDPRSVKSRAARPNRAGSRGSSVRGP